VTTADARSVARAPTARDVVRFAAFAVPQLAARLVRHLLMKEEWFILIRSRDAGYRRVPAPRSVYLADPWLVARDGRTYLFAESFDYAASKGSIVAAEVDAHGTVGRFRRALERDHHLSYPCVFEFDGDAYMIPEARANRTVDLYRAVQFPYEWKRVSVLFEDVLAVDPTILVHEGQLWLFMTISGASELPSDEELFLFFADDPRGPWSAHPCNPIVSDVRHARPAGAIFETAGALVRPAQDCLRGYGHAVALRRIDALSTTEYRESEFGRLTFRDVGARATDVHTVARSGALQAVDARRFRFRI